MTESQKNFSDEKFVGIFTDVTLEAIVGASLGAIVGALIGVLLLMKTFPVPANVYVGMWCLFLLFVALSAAFGATLIVVLDKSSDLRELRRYVHTFFSVYNHQKNVDDTLKILATQTNMASRQAINLRTSGIKSLEEELRESDERDLDLGHVLESCRRIQDDADKDFHKKQAEFYMVFDIAARFKEIFFLSLKEREFKAYVYTSAALAEQAAEKAEN